jgi:hypothetical protein
MNSLPFERGARYPRSHTLDAARRRNVTVYVENGYCQSRSTIVADAFFPHGLSRQPYTKG